jgi:hypothetical protein
MHLTASLGVNGENNLSWSDYVGVYPINTYVIYRSNQNGPFTEIGSVATTTRSFSDLNPPSGNNRYAIGFKPDLTCHSGSGSFSQGISNMVSFGVLSQFNIKLAKPQFSPNPTTDVIKFENLTKSNPAFRLTQMGGKLVMSGNINNQLIDMSRLAPGQYILSIDDYSAVIVGKQ